MKTPYKVMRHAATLLVLTLTASGATAQVAGLGGGASGQDMMTQMAPMLEIMKAKMGKRRFAVLVQTIGPMMSRMMENGSFNGTMGGSFGGFDAAYMPQGYGTGGDFTGMLGGNGGELMSMIPQLMRIADLGGGHRHRRRH